MYADLPSFIQKMQTFEQQTSRKAVVLAEEKLSSFLALKGEAELDLVNI